MTNGSAPQDPITKPPFDRKASQSLSNARTPAPATQEVKRSVTCAGMFGSGSTWIFNVIAKLLSRAHPNSRIVPLYADDLGPDQEALAALADCLVFKTHTPSPAMRLLSLLGNAPVVLSIRDPRDAVASLMKRFAVSFDKAFERVVACSNALVALRQLPHALLRYEDSFTEKEESIAQIAQHLGLELPALDRQSIFTALTPDAVKATIADLQACDAIVGEAPADASDPETQWHPGHVGDRRIGKWKDTLTAAQAARIRYATREFCSAFGYNDPGVPLITAEPISFSTEGTGVNYLLSGFSQQEDWGIWTAEDSAVIRINLEKSARNSLTIELQCWLAATLRRKATNSCARILINDAEMLRISADDQNPHDLLLCLRLSDPEILHADSIEIRFAFDNLLSPAELGTAPDSRLLGLGLLRLRLDT